MNNKPSRLSKEQVIWLNCLILALLVGRIGLGDYYFANEQLQDFAMAVWTLLLVFFAVFVSMGPRGIVRTISLIMAVPVALIASISSCAVAAGFVEAQEAVVLVGKADDVTFELIQADDLTYYDICKTWIELRMRRPVLNGILEQRETLISVQPAFGATAELIDHGKNIRFSSPALLGRKAILRKYSTDWEKARKNGLEQIPLTPAEQKGTGI